MTVFFFLFFFAGTPQDVHLNSVRELLLSVRGVLDVHSLHVWSLNMSHYLLSVHLAAGTRRKHGCFFFFFSNLNFKEAVVCFFFWCVLKWAKWDVVWLSWGCIFNGFTSLLSPDHTFIIVFCLNTQTYFIIEKTEGRSISFEFFFPQLFNQRSVTCVCPQRKMLMHTSSSQRQQSSCALNLGSPASRSRWSIHRTAADAAVTETKFSSWSQSLFIYSYRYSSLQIHLA